ncbi:MAG: hypothetical protein H6Q11_541, partial [Acidobacteria bacterium]|nr:hypothetical protein [Acidobacteriota bacterium]
MDGAVQLHHAVAQGLNPHEPGGDGLVDQRGAGAPAERVRVDDAPALHQGAALVEHPQEDRVGLLHPDAFHLGDRRGEARLGIEGVHQGGDARRLQGVEVGLAVGRRHVHQAGALVGADVVAGDDDEGAALALVREVVEGRPVGEADQVGPLGRRRHVHRVIRPVGGSQRRGDPVAAFVPARRGVDAHVVEARAHRHRQVGGQGPGGGGPHQQVVARLDRPPSLEHLQAHGQRRVLHVAVVHVGFEVGQGGGGPIRVGQHLEVAVDEAAVPEAAEHPPDRLHEAEVEGLVVVLEVHPPPDAP